MAFHSPLLWRSFCPWKERRYHTPFEQQIVKRHTFEIIETLFANHKHIWCNSHLSAASVLSFSTRFLISTHLFLASSSTKNVCTSPKKDLSRPSNTSLKASVPSSMPVAIRKVNLSPSQFQIGKHLTLVLIWNSQRKCKVYRWISNCAILVLRVYDFKLAHFRIQNTK